MFGNCSVHVSNLTRKQQQLQVSNMKGEAVSKFRHVLFLNNRV